MEMVIVGVVLWLAFIEVEKPKKGVDNGSKPGEDDSRVRKQPNSGSGVETTGNIKSNDLETLKAV